MPSPGASLQVPDEVALQTPHLPPHPVGGTHLLFVTPGTLQTPPLPTFLVGGIPLLATPGVVLEAICEWFWGLQAEPLLLCSPFPTGASRASCLPYCLNAPSTQ